MSIVKKSVGLLLSLMIAVGMFSIVPFTVSAEGAVSYWKDKYGYTEYFSDFWSAWNKAHENNATFGILCDWSSNNRRVVSEDHNVTVELNGHVLTRDMGKKSWKNDGEVFYVGKGATLTVYGGTADNPALGADTAHTKKGYTTIRNKDFDYTNVSFTGGMIHGGNSSNGAGGIHMKEKAKVNLYYTTVAGCRAEQTWGSDGYGGGVMMDGTNGILRMDHSTISYNYAYNDGGGVFVNNERCRIYMTKSHIDHNISDDNGGGIYVDSEYFRLEGDAEQALDPDAVTDWNAESMGSSVSHNYIVDSDMISGGGGGLYLWQDFAVVKGINFIDNDADDDGDGGGIFIKEENVAVKNCNFAYNRADVLGGGIYNNNDNNTIENCTIVKNQARDTGGAGGGIYTCCYNDINISGVMIIRDNTSKDYSHDNLYLAGYGANGTTAFVNPEISAGSDVHIRLSKQHKDQISVKGTFNEQWFTYDNANDNDPGRHIGWHSEDRWLEIMSGSKPTKTVDTFIPDSGKRTQTVSGGYTVNGTNYELLKGIAEYPSFNNTAVDLETVFYYSDGYFMGDTVQYNEHLATTSMCLAGAAGYSNIGGTENYLDKSNNFRQLMSDIGCRDEDIFVNDFNLIKPAADTIGVGLASKALPDGNTLVIVGVRGMGYEAEWISNMTLGTSGEAQGWSTAAGQVMAELKNYLERKGIDGSSDTTKFWITGYSRAGATANLTAKRVVDTYDHSGTHTFAYPLEAPKGGKSSEKVAGNNYNCIHNVINQNDVVTWVGTTEMGFIRYGTDHYVPGSATASASNSAWAVTKPSDKTAGYGAQRLLMRKQLEAVNADIIFDDYFHRASIDYIDSAVGGSLIDETVFDSWNTEGFIKLFFQNFQDYAFFYEENADARNAYAGVVINNGKTFQEAAATLANMLMGKPADQVDGLSSCFGDLMERLGTWDKLKLYQAIHKNQVFDPSTRLTTEENLELAINEKHWKDAKEKIWKLLTEINDEDEAKGYHKLSDYLNEQEIQELKDGFDTIMIPVIGLICNDYFHYDQDLLGTLAYNIPRIISNHYPEVTNAWLRSYDSFYANDTHAVTMESSVKTAPSACAVKITSPGGDGRVIIPDGSFIEVGAEDSVQLVPAAEVDRDRGEAIYYHFNTGKSSVQGLHAFSDSWNLKEMNLDYANGTGFFTLSVRTAHNDSLTDETTIALKLKGYAGVSYPDGFAQFRQYTYAVASLDIGETQEITFFAPEADEQTDYYRYSFKEWTVYEYDVLTGTVGDRIGVEHYAEYFGEGFDPNSAVTTVTNLAGVSARFVPDYDKIYNDLIIMLEGDYALPTKASCPAFSEYDMAVTWEYVTGKHSLDYLARFLFTVPEKTTLCDLSDLVIDWNGIQEYDFRDHEITDISYNGDVIQLTVKFTAKEQAAEDGGYLPANYATVVTYDLNKAYSIKAYRFYTESASDTHVKVFAPVIENMEFVDWTYNDDMTPVIDLPVGERTFARYQPIVNTIDVKLDENLRVGQALPGLTELDIRFTDTYRIENAAIDWLTTDTIAKPNTVYAACVSIDATDIMATDISVPGSESEPFTGKFSFAEDVAFNVRNYWDNAVEVTATAILREANIINIFLVFHKTDKEKISRFANICVSVPHNATQADILGELPNTVYAYLNEGRMVPVPAIWNRADAIDDDDPNAQRLKAYGEIDSDDYDAEGLVLTADVCVYASEKLSAPTATPSAGSYLGLQTIELTAKEEGAKIYYNTVITEQDADYPYPPGFNYHEYTEPITVNDYGMAVYIFAYSDKEGCIQSDLVSYCYKLTKPDVVKLEAKDAMIAESGNIACWYSTESRTHEDPETGEAIETVVPDRYYADEDCTVLLDYDSEVVIPAFIKTHYDAAADIDGNLPGLGYGDSAHFHGLETIGVQSISGSDDVRVLTIVDSRALRDATDYGWLFAVSEDANDDDPALTAANAPFRYSCKNSENTMVGGYGNNVFTSTPYKYLTARIHLDSASGKTVRSVFYIKLENGTDYVYSAEKDSAPTIDSSDDMDTVTDNFIFDATRDLLFAGHSLSLKGDIGVNFFLNLTAEQAAKTFVSFSWFDKTYTDDTLELDPCGSGYYKASCPIAAAEMTYDITATVTIDRVVQDETDTYSAVTYANVIMNDESFRTKFVAEKGETKYNRLVTLVKTMLDYGSKAQVRFDRNKGNLANGGTDFFTGEVTIPNNASDMDESLSNCGLEYVGTSIVYLSETTLRHYYRIVDPSKFTDEIKNGITFDSEAVTCGEKNGMIYFDKKDIAASQLDTEYVISINGHEYHYAALDYSSLAYSLDDKPYNESITKQLAAAAYRYNQAANAYFAD